MNILLAGGSGMIGAALSAELVARGHTVTILTRNLSSNNIHHPGINYARWDGRSPEGWSHLLENTDAVVNLTGENLAKERWSPQRKNALRDSRIDAGRGILQAITKSKHKPGVLIQASGIGAYGTSSSLVFDESSPYGSDFLSSICVSWESSTRPVEDMDVRHVVIRSGVVLSKRGGALPLMVLPFRFFAGGPLGSGKQWMPWIHIQDEVNAIIHLITSPKASGTYNLIAANHTNRQVASAIGRSLNRPSLLPAPAFVLRAILGEMSIMVLDGQQASNQKLISSGYQFRFSQLSAAMDDLLKTPSSRKE
jgi:uncharacterized protein (TIGR01777 family)